MLPRSDKSKRVHPDCPDELRCSVDIAIALRLSGQGILVGETVHDMVKRICPDIFKIVEPDGFELRFDLTENTHRALCKGKIAYQIRRKPRH